MIFKGENDERLHGELLQNRVYSLREFGQFRVPQEGRLIDVLVDNAEKLESSRWIAWLIQRHRFARIATIVPQIDWVSSLTVDADLVLEMQEKDLFPVEAWNGAALVACCRPDAVKVFGRLRKAIHVEQLFPLAASPLDIRNLRETFQKNVCYN